MKFFNSFLHVRGGVSSVDSMYTQTVEFSPRAWRCFLAGAMFIEPREVFSTCVEVFLKNVLLFPVAVEFSPRAWRCFSA